MFTWIDSGTTTINSVIADIGGGATTLLAKAGNGTLVLGGAIPIAAGTALDQGILNFAYGTLPHGAANIHFYGGTLQWASGNTQDISAGIAPIAGGQTAILDTNGNDVSFATGLSGSGGLTKVGGGVLTFLGATVHGATTISAGTLQLGNGAAGTTARSPATSSTTRPLSMTSLAAKPTAARSAAAAASLKQARQHWSSPAAIRTPATTIAAGVLLAGGSNSLSPNSAVTVNGGTLDASAFANTVKSLTISGGGLNLGMGNTLICSGPAVLAGNLNVAGAGTLGSYQLLTYASMSGSFAGGTLDPNYGLLYTATELDAVHKAQVGILAVTAANPTVITGGTTALTVGVSNSVPAASDALNFTALASGSGYGGSTSGSLAAAGSGNYTLASGFNSTSLPAGSYTGTVTVTGSNSALGGLALNSGAVQTVTVNVLDHAAGSVAVTSGNGFLVHAGATGLSAVVVVNNAAGTRSDLEIDSAPSIASGALSSGPATPYYVSAGSGQTYTASFDAGNTPGAFSNTVTFAAAGDNQSLPGANALGSLAVSITGNVYSGKAQWNAGNGTWVAGANWQDTVGGGPSGAPGVSGYATDTATFGTVAASGTVIVSSRLGRSLLEQPRLQQLQCQLLDSGRDGYHGVDVDRHGRQQSGRRDGDERNALGGDSHFAGSNLVVSSSGSLTLGGNVSDGGLAKSLTLDGGGTLILSGTNSYGGGTEVNAGTLILASSSAIANGTSLTVGAGGALIFDPSMTAGVRREPPFRPCQNPARSYCLSLPGVLWLRVNAFVHDRRNRSSHLWRRNHFRRRGIVQP